MKIILQMLLNGSVVFRLLQFPPAWLYRSRLANTPWRFWFLGARAIPYLRIVGIICSMRGIWKGKISNIGLINSFACEVITNRSFAAFVPYYRHFYLAMFGISLFRSFDQPFPKSLQLLPMAIYSSSGIAKWLDSSDWVNGGLTVRNAVSLYSVERGTFTLSENEGKWLARMILIWEVLAYPLSLMSNRFLRGYQISGLCFHLVNFALLRISFWHLAVLHLIFLIDYVLCRGSSTDQLNVK